MQHGGSRLVEGREGMPLGVITFHLDVDVCVCVCQGGASCSISLLQETQMMVITLPAAFEQNEKTIRTFVII